MKYPSMATSARVIRFIPLAVVVAVVLSATATGLLSDIIGFYNKMLYVRGRIEPNLLFYIGTTLFLAIYPLIGQRRVWVEIAYILVCSFYLFQIEYAGMTGLFLNLSGDFPSHAKALYLNPFVLIPALGIFMLLLATSGMRRVEWMVLCAAITLSAGVATYHSYWSWLGLLQQSN